MLLTFICICHYLLLFIKKIIDQFFYKTITYEKLKSCFIYMDFKNKYFKYKKKYLNLKQKSFSQQGGSREEFFKKFNKINKGQIYKTKRKIGWRGEEQV